MAKVISRRPGARRVARRPATKVALLPGIEQIAKAILEVRGHRVILGPHLAKMYGVETRALTQAVRRNLEKFPEDFLFQLTWDEVSELSRSQNVILNVQAKRASKTVQGKNIKFRPYAFTEHGAIMAANMLKSATATRISVYVVRAFVGLRNTLATHAELSRRLEELDAKMGSRLDKHDQEIATLMNAIRQLLVAPIAKKRKPIGFHTEANEAEKD